METTTEPPGLTMTIEGVTWIGTMCIGLAFDEASVDTTSYEHGVSRCIIGIGVRCCQDQGNSTNSKKCSASDIECTSKSDHENNPPSPPKPAAIDSFPALTTHRIGGSGGDPIGHSKFSPKLRARMRRLDNIQG